MRRERGGNVWLAPRAKSVRLINGLWTKTWRRYQAERLIIVPQAPAVGIFTRPDLPANSPFKCQIQFLNTQQRPILVHHTLFHYKSPTDQIALNNLVSGTNTAESTGTVRSWWKPCIWGRLAALSDFRAI